MPAARRRSTWLLPNCSRSRKRSRTRRGGGRSRRLAWRCSSVSSPASSSGADVIQPLATLCSVAEARHAPCRPTPRRCRLALLAGCALAGLVFLVFALAAATVALTERFGLLQALGDHGGRGAGRGPAADRRLGDRGPARRRTRAPARALDRQLLASAAIRGRVPRAAHLPARGGIGLGLVALGAALVLASGGASASRRGLSGPC